MIVTIGGNLGAGKTTLASKLAVALNYQQLYVGGIFREMAAEKKLSIEQFYTELKEDPAVEQAVDQRQAELMRTQDNTIVQGRIAWYFAKSSPFEVFNLMLTVDPAVGAQRSGMRSENVGRSVDEMVIATAEREKMERERYQMLYAIKDHLDPANYDLIIDTTSLSEEEVFQKALAAIQAKLN